MKLADKPKKPLKPKKYIVTEKNFYKNLYLESIKLPLSRFKIPPNIDLSKVYLSVSLEDADTLELSVDYISESKNEKFDSEMKQFESDIDSYDLRLKKYKDEIEDPALQKVLLEAYKNGSIYLKETKSTVAFTDDLLKLLVEQLDSKVQSEKE